MKKFLIVLAFSSFVLNCAQSVVAQTIDRIAELQNSRSLADGDLYHYLLSSNPSERSHAAVALANIQDSSSMQFLFPLLNDSDPAVRRSTAFAFGQIGNSQAASRLLERIKTESDGKCLQEMIDAIGKCGSREHLKALVEVAPTLPREVQSSVALSIAHLRSEESRILWRPSMSPVSLEIRNPHKRLSTR